ncbi:cilia- and flagella-associated protein 47 [Grus japonensis]|uniref:Cilia- and flagella-associated protein 47 n=1 Tax=Grus japonensis TaxID=30415 RepID=A0ABC9VZU4_GRUJA
MAAGWRDVAGVRIAPAELRFRDAVSGGRYRAALSVQNRRLESCRLQLLPPRRPQFKLIVKNPEKPVASGLQVTAFVEYYPESEEDLEDRLLLLVEDDIVDIPVLGLIPCCYLEIESEINFGTVIANSKIISKEISISNHGSSSGTFKISYDGVVLLNIEPTSGAVEPNSVKMVKVDICTDVPRIIKEVIKQFCIYNNSVNIGLKPAEGLMSPKISITDFHKEKLQFKMLPLDENCLLTSRKLAAIGSKSSIKEIWNGLSAMPSSTQEKEDCSLTLTSKQLHQIFIGPSTMDFGDVCVYSTTARKLHIVNNLSVHIWIQIEIEIDELQETSPLSQVVPPLTKTHIPVVFETSTLGMFKSYDYPRYGMPQRRDWFFFEAASH